MTEMQFPAEYFEADRDRLRATAVRLLGSADEADAAVGETWRRLSRTDAGNIGNVREWLTMIVGRVCTDMLRARAESGASGPAPGPAPSPDPAPDPPLGDSVGLALQVVLERLPPAERLAFLLHDVFALPDDEVARIVGRSPSATHRLAGRARLRIQGGTPEPEHPAPASAPNPAPLPTDTVRPR